MFNKLLNRITSPDQGKPPPKPPDTDTDERSQTEGFICPHCLLAFPTADLLQNHYINAHQDGVAGSGEEQKLVKCSVCKMKFGTEKELNEHHSCHHKQPTADLSEVELLKTQVRALEEGKSLTSSEILLLRKQLSDTIDVNATLRHEKSKLQRKATIENEELSILKLQIDEQQKKYHILENELKRCQEMKSTVELQLQQRPGADDVKVLREELVSVQKMMDKLTLEKEAEKDAIQKDYFVLQERYSSLEEQKHILEEALKKVPQKEEMERLRKELLEKTATSVDLQKTLSQRENENKSIAEKYEKVEAELNKVKNDYSQLELTYKEEITKSVHNNNTKNKEINDLQLSAKKNQDDLQDKEKQITSINQKLTQLQDDYQNMCKEKENLKKELIEKNKQLENSQRIALQRDEKLKELETQLCSVKDTISRLESERAELYVKIEAGEGTNTAFQQLQQENDRLNKVMKEQKDTAKENMAQIVAKYDTICQQHQETKSRLQTVTEKCQKAEITINELNQRLNDAELKFNQLKEDLNKKKIELQSVRNEKDSLQENLKQQEKDNVSLREQLKEILDAKQEMEEKVTQQELQLQIAKTEKEEYLNQLSSKNIKLEESEKEITNLKQKCVQIEQTADLFKGELQTLHTNFEEVANKLNKSESEKQDLLSNIKSLKEQLKATIEELEKSQVNEQQLSITLEDFNEIKKELSDKIKDLDTELAESKRKEEELTNQKASLDLELKNATQRISEITEMNTELEHSFSMLQQTYQQLKEKKNQEIAELNDAKMLLINQKLSLQGEIDQLKEEMNQLEVNHQQEVQVFQEHSKNFKLKIEELNRKLEDEINLQKKLQSEWQMQEAKYDTEISVLNENLSTLREDLYSEQSRRENLEKKTDQLKGDNLELEAKLDNALDERRALLERCIKSEGECEKLRESTVDLRHKLDDTVAALQELGRENQTLQIENTKHQNRKWTEDSDVTHCTMCGKQFSVTLRKHHCRNCGNIFCNDCSSKTAPIAVSKKPVRVCDTCYGECLK